LTGVFTLAGVFPLTGVFTLTGVGVFGRTVVLFRIVDRVVDLLARFVFARVYLAIVGTGVLFRACVFILNRI